MKKNLDLRIEALIKDVPLCLIADKLGENRHTFYTDLRKREFKQPEKAKVLDTIELLSYETV